MFSPFLLTYYFRIFLFAKTHKPLSKILTPLEKSLRKFFDLSSLKTIESFSSPFLGLVSSTTSYRLFFPLNCFFFLDIMKYALSLSLFYYIVLLAFIFFYLSIVYYRCCIKLLYMFLFYLISYFCPGLFCYYLFICFFNQFCLFPFTWLLQKHRNSARFRTSKGKE